MELRPATPADAEAIVQIYAPYVASNAVSFEDTVPTKAEMKRRIDAHDEIYPWIVAADPATNVILGYAYAKPMRVSPAYQFAAEVAVYSAGEMEGKGIRKTLLSALLATLTEQNYTQAILTLLTPNDKLIQLYEGAGFRRAGQYREICFKNGQWLDIGLWQRDLSDATIPPQPIKLFAETGIRKG